MGKKQKNRKKAVKPEMLTLRLDHFDEQQQEAVLFALTHAATLALLMASAIPAIEEYLDCLEHLELSFTNAKQRTPFTLSLTPNEYAQLLAVIKMHLLVLQYAHVPPSVELPGPQHRQALEAFFDLVFSRLPTTTRFLVERGIQALKPRVQA